MNKRICHKHFFQLLLQAFLISYALCTVFHLPLDRADYKAPINYYLAEAAELLGEYQFLFPVIMALAFVFLYRMRESGCETLYTGKMLPAFFAVCLLVGNSYRQTGTSAYLTGSPVNLIKSVLAFWGYAILFRQMLALLEKGYDMVSCSGWNPPVLSFLWEGSSFRKIFLLLLLLWAPVILLSFPGNICYDVIGQIEQGLGRCAYSAHHPLLHTLLLGGILKCFYFLTGSYDAGLFFYLWVQAAALSAALSGTLAWLKKRNCSPLLLDLILLLYILSPMYSNMVSTAIKDIPFMAAFIWYLLLLAAWLENREKGKDIRFIVSFITAQVLTALLRNNGFYVILISGIILSAAFWNKTEKGMRIRLLLCLPVLPVLLSFGINAGFKTALCAEAGGFGEMLSLPFQQTARYLQFYQGELSERERQSIEAVLGDVSDVAASYDPEIADPVKAHYDKTASAGEVACYLAVWGEGFLKHPGVYADAFLVHVYGWFDPAVTNAVRYEAESDLFPRRGLFTDADKVLLFVYRLADRISLLSLLQNVGFYTWGLFAVTGIMRRKRSPLAGLSVPLFISLLICMASPCFYLHARYAYPIMFTVPFLYGAASEKGAQT